VLKHLVVVTQTTLFPPKIAKNEKKTTTKQTS